MKKGLFLSVVCFIASVSGLVADEITGFWKSINEETKQTQCIIAVYEHKDKFYGRIIGTCDGTGKMVDNIYAPKGRAPGIAGTPYYSGLDLIWNLSSKGARYKGKIVDPEKGNVYNAMLWIKNGNLIVRGELLVFGRNTTWLPVTEVDFPKGFKVPNTAEFVPIIPQVN